MNVIDLSMPATESHDLTLLMSSEAYTDPSHPGHLHTKEVVRRHFEACYPASSHGRTVSAIVFDGHPGK